MNKQTPTYIKNYKLPSAQTETIHSQVKKWLQQNVVEQSISPYNSLLLLMSKEKLNWYKQMEISHIFEET